MQAAVIVVAQARRPGALLRRGRPLRHKPARAIRGHASACVDAQDVALVGSQHGLQIAAQSCVADRRQQRREPPHNPALAAISTVP